MWKYLLCGERDLRLPGEREYLSRLDVFFSGVLERRTGDGVYLLGEREPRFRGDVEPFLRGDGLRTTLGDNDPLRNGECRS